MKLSETLKLIGAGFTAKEIREMMEQENKPIEQAVPEVKEEVKEEPKVDNASIRSNETEIDYRKLFEEEQKKNEVLERNNKALQGLANRIDIGQDVVEDVDDILDNIFRNNY